MPRIPEHELDRLKSQVSIQRLAEAAGLELSRHGSSDFITTCPWHADDTPSLVISPGKNLWHCLGACQAGGSVIDWVMRFNNVSFRHAVEMLRADTPLAADRAAPAAKRRLLPEVVAPDHADGEALGAVVTHYHETLSRTPDALDYLAGRGLDHPDFIETFSVGFCDRTLGYHLPDRSCQSGAEIRDRLQGLGVLRASGHELFRGSVVFPVFDDTGAVSEMYGRKISHRLRKGTPKHLYLPGPHRGVWNAGGLSGSGDVILCESLIDAATFWCAGYRNVTASYGTAGFTDEHAALLQRLDVGRVLIAYDRDAAGDAAAHKLAGRLGALGISCARVLFPKGTDANTYATRMRPAERALGLVLRHAEWMDNSAPPPAAVPAPIPEPVDLSPADLVPADLVPAEPGPAEPEPAEPEIEPDPELPAHITEPPPLAASAAPGASPVPGITTDVRDNEIICRLGDRRYRVRGLDRNTGRDALKVNVLAARGDAFFVDTFDLYAARYRRVFIREAAAELGVEEPVIKSDLGRVLLSLEEQQDRAIAEALTPEATAYTMTSDERAAAMALLTDPALIDRITTDIEATGIVGEQTNMLVGYLASVSRRLEAPLAVIVQSSSAAGKSSLLDGILSFVPPEEVVKYSAMTGQSLFYMGETNLQHRVLAIVEEEGAERASYALKLLQSEGEITIASTGKEPATGRMVTHEYRVEGPVMILLTTTAIDVDEELLNRCLVLAVSEDRAQTSAIHDLQRQRRTLSGRLDTTDATDLIALHRNARRLLEDVWVVNPYAGDLTFPTHRTRTRRDHAKYLSLIDAIAFIHQFQRPTKTAERHGKKFPYIEVTLDDIALANRLAHEVLGRTLDELPPQTRTLLDRLTTMVIGCCERLGIEIADYRFTRRQLREYTGFGNTQLRVHLERLIELEYLLVHHGRRGQQFVYELLHDAGAADADAPRLAGLVDVDELRRRYDRNLAGGLRGHDGVMAGPSRGAESAGESDDSGQIDESSRGRPEITYGGHDKTYTLRRTVIAEA